MTSPTSSDLKLLILDELNQVTEKYDNLMALSQPGYSPDSIRSARDALRYVKNHHAALLRIAQAAGLPTRTFERTER